jgi:hypothetical protein
MGNLAHQGQTVTVSLSGENAEKTVSENGKVE